MGALSPTGYEPSLPLCCILCLFVFFGALCVTLNHLGSYLSHLSYSCLSAFWVENNYLCLSGFPVGNYLHPFELLSVGKLFVSFEVICIEILSLHCISHLWGLLSFCSLLCTHLCVCCVEIHLHPGTSTLSLVRGSPNSTPTGSFSFCPHHHHHLLCFSMSFLPISTTSNFNHFTLTS
jgi:hypothetical protein